VLIAEGGDALLAFLPAAAACLAAAGVAAVWRRTLDRTTRSSVEFLPVCGTNSTLGAGRGA
jgi:hypothetical protein